MEKIKVKIIKLFQFLLQQVFKLFKYLSFRQSQGDGVASSTPETAQSFGGQLVGTKTEAKRTPRGRSLPLPTPGCCLALSLISDHILALENSWSVYFFSFKNKTYQHIFLPSQSPTELTENTSPESRPHCTPEGHSANEWPAVGTRRPSPASQSYRLSEGGSKHSFKKREVVPSSPCTYNNV